MTSNASEDRNKAIALLGGTFDPLHYGHIYSAEHAARSLGLDHVVLLPAHIPPHKTSTGANSQQRLTMLKTFVNQVETQQAQQTPSGTDADGDSCERLNFTIDERELNAEQTSYTIHTLRAMKAEYPQQKIFFIIGMDSLLSFTRWHLWQEILTLCHLVVNTRPGSELNTEALDKQTQQLLSNHQAQSTQELYQTEAGKIFFTKPITQNISSTELRQSLKQQSERALSQAKQSHAQAYCQQWLPAGILEFIEQQKLYR